VTLQLLAVAAETAMKAVEKNSAMKAEGKRDKGG
jgi:hypothetical protein